jgi:hypothetical protein
VVATMRRAVTRRALVGGALLAAAGALLPAVPASAAVRPTAMAITGEGLAEPLTVVAETEPDLCSALWSQVSWMADRPGQTRAPKAAKQGPRYTVVVSVKGQAKQTYDLYPLAQGGPRVFRPAKQPDQRRTTSAWFFGRLNMAEVLRFAGVPLPEHPGSAAGGVGGGRGERASVLTPVDDLDGVFGQWQQVFMLNAAVVVAIALGLAGFSLLVRRKV